MTDTVSDTTEVDRKAAMARAQKDYEAAQKASAERRSLMQNVAHANAVERNRSLIVQKEIGTRARDGIMLNTPAAYERHEQIRNALDLNSDGVVTDVPDRLESMAARLMNITPSGAEALALEMAGMAAELRGSKPASPRPASKAA